MVEEEYTETEKQLLKLMEEDSFFASLPEGLGEEQIQTMGHLASTRNLADLLPSSDAVDAAFELHSLAIDRMATLFRSVQTSCQEWTASRKAIKKARELHQKAVEAERKRQEKKREKEEKKRQDDAAKEARLAAQAAAAENPDNSAGIPVPDDRPKKRRVASKITNELTDEDPLVLRDKFPENQIHVVDEYEPFLWLSLVFLFAPVHMSHSESATCLYFFCNAATL